MKDGFLLKIYIATLTVFITFSRFAGSAAAGVSGGREAGPAEVARGEIGSAAFRKAVSHYLTGVIYQNERDPEKAAESYRRALKYDPGSVFLRLRIAACYIFTGQNRKALRILDEAKRMDPANSAVSFMLALVYTNEGKFGLAQKEYESVVAAKPGDREVLENLADILTIQEKLEEAVAVYENLIETKTGAPAPLYFNLGILYLKLGRMDDAQRAMVSAIELDEDNINAHLALGYIYEARKDYPSSVKTYAGAIEIDPEDIRLRHGLARSFYNAGNAKKAREAFEEMSVDFPDDPDACVALAMFYMKEKDPASAVSVIEKAEAMGVRQSTDFFFISGRAYYDLGEYDKSAACFRQGLSIYPEDPNLRFYLGVVYDKAGLRTLAANELRKTIKIDPEMHEALNYLGYLYAEDGVNLEEAERLVRRALSLSPGNAAYMDSLGWVLYKKGEYEKAAEELSAAAESAADDATIREHLGDAYHKLKDLDRAGTEWEKALELDPARSEVTEKLKALKERAVRVN